MEQLTHFVLGQSEWGGDYHAFLGHSLPLLKDLRYLYVHLGSTADWVESWYTITTPIQMEKVEALALTYMPEGMVYTDVFDRIDFPNLKSLQIQGMEMHLFGVAPVTYASWHPPENVQRFLAKLESFQHLESLTFEVRYGAVGLDALFRALPRLTNLDISVGGEGYQDYLRLLTLGPETKTHLLTQLRTIVMGVDKGIRIDPQLLDEFLRSRVQSDTRAVRLEKFVCHTSGTGIQNHGEICTIIQSHSLRRLSYESIVYNEDMGGQDWVLRNCRMKDWPEVKSVVETYYM
ncbi:hypothetical protein MD484_g5600, partial [Candolleomyces efflorescens]